MHDVLRGSTAALPVGTADECLYYGVPGETVLDVDIPSAGESFFYLVRGRNSIGAGSYGTHSDGTERVTNACP